MPVEQRRQQRTRREYVDIDDAEQFRLWCLRLACTEEELRRAIRAAGTLVQALRVHFRIRRSVRAAIRYGRTFEPPRHSERDDLEQERRCAQ